MSPRPFVLHVALILLLVPALCWAAPPEEEPAKTEQTSKAKQGKKKLVVDFSEVTCEPPDCVIEGEHHEPQLLYVIGRQGVVAETEGSVEEAMRREERSLKKAGDKAKK